MRKLQFILESTSNKKLDALAKEIIHSVKVSGAVKAGPIAFKNKRMIYIYNCNNITYNLLMKIKPKLYKHVDVTISSL